MRNTDRVSLYGWLLVAAVSLGVAGAAGCSTRNLPQGQPGTGGSLVGSGGVVGTGQAGNTGNASGTGGGPSTTGTGGAAGMASACQGAGDPRLVLAGQRILRLTMTETVNTVRYLIDDTEATALVKNNIISGTDYIETLRRFPPLAENDIDSTSFAVLDRVVSHVAAYVQDNFANLTGCLPPVTDGCAKAYLANLATKAYRRRLTTDEQTRLDALFTRLRSEQTVNGYLVTYTVEEATNYSVYALLSSPQMLWRWEIGDTTSPSAAPAGIPLTEQEVATQLSFFLTDQPPDAQLIAAADAGTLRANLSAHVDRLLASQVSRDWLRTIMETYFQTNLLPAVSVDPNQFPLFTPALAADMSTETRRFLDDALWNGSLSGLLTSRTAFVNTTLAANVYGVTVPAGASPTNFVQTTLPAAQRSGLLTNPGFLAAHATFSGQDVAARGLLVNMVLLCMPSPGSNTGGQADPAQTGQQQVAMRAAQPTCSSCHAQFDAYGLALENYDNVGRYRTTDGMGRAIDAHATLPDVQGGGTVENGVELAQQLADSPAFKNCMARTLLQYAMVDRGTNVEVPMLPQQAGCATADVVSRFQSSGGAKFADLVRATAASPAFVLRRAAP